jgi:hypothetical protein
VGDTLHITYRPRADTTPEGELAAIYRILILQKGDRNDLTGTSTKEYTTSQDMKGKGNADVHSD